MRWYVLQTKAGEEEKLVEIIHRIVPKQLYGECFIVYHEQLWRRQRKNFVHVKRAFPGYVFITSNEPEALFFCLKKLPAMAKLITDDESCFLSLIPEEALFLEQITNENHIIGLSYLNTDGNGIIHQVSGPLASCISQIVRYQFGKRYVLVRIALLGKEKHILLGIVLNEDIRQEIQNGKVKASVQIPRQYQAAQNNNRIKTLHSRKFSAGELVEVTGGTFQGISAMVYQMKEKTVKIGIQFFGRDIEAELPVELVKKY